MSGKTYKELLEQLAPAQRMRVKQRAAKLIANEKSRRASRKKVSRVATRSDADIDTTDIPPLTDDFFRRAARNPFFRSGSRGRLRRSHPGRILREEYMRSAGLSPRGLAEALHVSLAKVVPILESKRGVSAEMAVLLSVYFGTSDSYWINLQTYYDLQRAKESVRKKVARIIPLARVNASARQPPKAGARETLRFPVLRGGIPARPIFDPASGLFSG